MIKTFMAWAGGYFYLGLLVIALGVVFYIHHQGYQEGLATSDVRVANAERDRDTAKKQSAALADLMRQLNQQAADDKKEADDQKQRAAQALVDLAAYKKTHSLTEAQWQAKLKKTSADNSCPTLKELLCESVMDY